MTLMATVSGVHCGCTLSEHA